MGQVLLVRHGQASWGAADYDVLSDRGQQQARLVGRTLAGLRPELVVHGDLRRQRDTARIAAEAAGWTAPFRADARWNEFDSLDVLARLPRQFAGDGPSPAEFQDWFEAATDRWVGGEYAEEYAESWEAFLARALAAITDLAQVGTAVVFTSGGPIAAVVSTLLDAGPASYRRLAPVLVNASLTRIISGRRGLSVVAFNEQAHLGGDGLLTYR